MFSRRLLRVRGGSSEPAPSKGFLEEFDAAFLDADAEIRDERGAGGKEAIDGEVEVVGTHPKQEDEEDALATCGTRVDWRTGERGVDFLSRTHRRGCCASRASSRRYVHDLELLRLVVGTVLSRRTSHATRNLKRRDGSVGEQGARHDP